MLGLGDRIERKRGSCFDLGEKRASQRLPWGPDPCCSRRMSPTPFYLLPISTGEKEAKISNLQLSHPIHLPPLLTFLLPPGPALLTPHPHVHLTPSASPFPSPLPLVSTQTLVGMPSLVCPGVQVDRREWEGTRYFVRGAVHSCGTAPSQICQQSTAWLQAWARSSGHGGGGLASLILETVFSLAFRGLVQVVSPL